MQKQILIWNKKISHKITTKKGLQIPQNFKKPNIFID